MVGRELIHRAGVSITLVVSSMLLLTMPLLAHYFLGYSAVDVGDNGREIRWLDYTQYDDARSWAIDQWHAQGKVAILPQAAGHIVDLEWRDYNDCGPDAYIAYYQYYPYGIDKVYMNTCKMNSKTSAQKRSVAVHEQGHALGLAHNPSNDQIMYEFPASIAYTTPQAHDLQDYHELWP